MADNGPDIARLTDAAMRGDVTAVEALRVSGVDIIGSRQKDGMSSILLACRNGKVDLVRYLLDQGASPDDKEYYGGTCLMAAACYAHPDCVSCLIDAGAEVKYAYSGDNATIIYMTVLCFSDPKTYYDFEEGHVVRTVQLLLDAGAPWNTPANGHISNGRTALQMLQDMDMSAVDDKVKQERDGIIELLKMQSRLEYSDDDNESYCGEYEDEESDEEEYSDE